MNLPTASEMKNAIRWGTAIGVMWQADRWSDFAEWLKNADRPFLWVSDHMFEWARDLHDKAADRFLELGLHEGDDGHVHRVSRPFRKALELAMRPEFDLDFVDLFHALAKLSPIIGSVFRAEKTIPTPSVWSTARCTRCGSTEGATVGWLVEGLCPLCRSAMDEAERAQSCNCGVNQGGRPLRPDDEHHPLCSVQPEVWKRMPTCPSCHSRLCSHVRTGEDL